jgi:hypothetical protein
LARIAVRRQALRMRRCLLLAAPLAGIAAFACANSAPQPMTPQPDALLWRRTCDGWEQCSWLAPMPPPLPTPAHPFCLATLQVLSAAIALVGRQSLSGRGTE